AASVTGARRIKGPGAAALDGLAARTGNGRRSVIFQRHFLAALGRVAAGIGRAPGARGVVVVAATTGGIGHGVEGGDGHVAAGVAGARRSKGPGAGALDGLVGHDGDGRRGRVAHGDGLHQVGAVARVVGRGPGAGDDLGAAATIADAVTVIDQHRTA